MDMDDTTLSDFRERGVEYDTALRRIGKVGVAAGDFIVPVNQNYNDDAVLMPSWLAVFRRCMSVTQRAARLPQRSVDRVPFPAAVL